MKQAVYYDLHFTAEEMEAQGQETQAHLLHCAVRSTLQPVPLVAGQAIKMSPGWYAGKNKQKKERSNSLECSRPLRSVTDYSEKLDNNSAHSLRCSTRPLIRVTFYCCLGATPSRNQPKVQLPKILTFDPSCQRERMKAEIRVRGRGSPKMCFFRARHPQSCSFFKQTETQLQLSFQDYQYNTQPF